jgi:hypothetical protein
MTLFVVVGADGLDVVSRPRAYVASVPAVGGGSRAHAHASHRRLRERIQEHQGPAPSRAGRRAPRVDLKQVAVLLPQRLRPEPGRQRVVPQVREHADLVLVLHHAPGAHDAPRGVQHGVAEHLSASGGKEGTRGVSTRGRGGSARDSDVTFGKRRWGVPECTPHPSGARG